MTVLQPLAHGAVELDGAGWLGDWQRRNREVTLPHVLGRVASGEAEANLLRLLQPGLAAHRGMVFTDSDVYKALEAVAWTMAAAGEDDPEVAALAEQAQRLASLVSLVQEPDGYVNSWVQGTPSVERWSNPQWGHELYSAGHLLQAAVAASRAGVLPDLVEAAGRFADLLVTTFGPGQPPYVEGHPLLEMALVEWFRTTGEVKYLTLAVGQLAGRGHGRLGEDRFGSAYFQDNVPLRRATSAAGHAVRQLYLMAGAVDIATETGDGELLAAVERLWDDLYAGKTYITGVSGSRHRDEAIGDRYELPPDRAYAETCAAIAAFQLGWRLLLSTGKACYAQAMETSLYNAIAASTSAAGDAFFYVNPLQLRVDHRDGGDAQPGRQPWFDCACCPPNLTRLVASLQDYLITTSADGVQVHHPAAGKVRLVHEGADIRLETTTEFPYGGEVVISVECDSPLEWELALRVPDWSPAAQLSVDRSAVQVEATDGYLRVRRSWAGRHEVRLQLDVSPRCVVPHPRIDAVRGCVAVTKGPLVYALEQADLPPGVAVEDLVLVALDTPASDATQDEPGPGGERVRIVASAREPRSDELYAPQRAVALSPPMLVSLVPYYRWANRGPGAMRVWIPLAPATSADPELP